jgi:hypothetical protein
VISLASLVAEVSHLIVHLVECFKTHIVFQQGLEALGHIWLVGYANMQVQFWLLLAGLAYL